MYGVGGAGSGGASSRPMSYGANAQFPSVVDTKPMQVKFEFNQDCFKKCFFENTYIMK